MCCVLKTIRLIATATGPGFVDDSGRFIRLLEIYSYFGQLIGALVQSQILFVKKLSFAFFEAVVRGFVVNRSGKRHQRRSVAMSALHIYSKVVFLD